MCSWRTTARLSEVIAKALSETQSFPEGDPWEDPLVSSWKRMVGYCTPQRIRRQPTGISSIKDRDVNIDFVMIRLERAQAQRVASDERVHEGFGRAGGHAKRDTATWAR